MIPTLYDKFKPWSERGSVYIISDTHFEDSDCKLMDANWITPQEHIDIIKRTVHKNDTLIHLGDVGNPKWMEQIKAYKVLIMGNHDESATKFKRNKKETVFLDHCTDEEIKKMQQEGRIDESSYHLYYQKFTRGWRDNNLFDEVYTGPLFIAEKILLSHEPIVNGSTWYNIHGHDHNSKKLPWEEDDFMDYWNEINLASNVVNYQVFNLGKAIKEGLLSCVDGVHRLTIDKASGRR